jgi:hypothetical protein
VAAAEEEVGLPEGAMAAAAAGAEYGWYMVSMCLLLLLLLLLNGTLLVKAEIGMLRRLTCSRGYSQNKQSKINLRQVIWVTARWQIYK